MQKKVQLFNKGMQRDLSVSKASSEYAYENKNIRIMPTDENTLLSVINEKGNKATTIDGIGNTIEGTPIGQALIDNELILFTAGDPFLIEVPAIEAEELDIENIVSESLSIDIDADVQKKEDRIYKLWFDNGKLAGNNLYKGQLGFNYNNPIEAISFYENSDIKKIYWTDGINPPRVINVASSTSTMSKWKDTSFDFTRVLKLKEEISISRNIIANGMFSPGTIQYAFTYFDKYSQESNIFYTSPLYYISYNNRGASPEDKVGNSFDISIDWIDDLFDYVRVYSIQRTSIDAIPTVKRVVDLAPPTGPVLYREQKYVIYTLLENIIIYDRRGKAIPLSNITPISTGDWKLDSSIYYKVIFTNSRDYIAMSMGTGQAIFVSLRGNKCTVSIVGNTDEFYLYSYTRKKVTYTDIGTSGDIIDPTELIYIGGEDVIFGTMMQKDNTLFLGDLTLNRKLIPNSVRNFLKEGDISFSTYSYYNPKKIESVDPVGYYAYNNQLKLNSYQFKIFKYLETYRFGVQFQHKTGKWSEPIWINDVRNTERIQGPYINQGDIYLPKASYTLYNKEVIESLLELGYIRARPVVVYPTLSDRECVCQGVLCPTVYNVGDRYGNSPFVQSSWFTRANAPFDEYKAFHYSEKPDGSWISDWADRNQGPFTFTINSRAGVMSNDRASLKVDNSETIDMDMVNKGSWAEFRHNYPIPSNNKRNAEIQCIWNPPTYPTVYSSSPESQVNRWVSIYAENFYVDQSILTLHSPDIEFDTNVRSIDTSGLKLRIVGIVPLTAFVGDIDIQTSTPPNSYKGSSEVAPGFYKEPIGAENVSRFGFKGLMSGAFWFDEISDYKEDKENPNKYTTGFVVYPFHRNGSLNNKKWATNGYRPAMLDKKKISNMRYSFNSYYFPTSNIWTAYESGSSYLTGISGVTVFDSNEVTLSRLPAPKNSSLPEINYYGNVDKVITVSRIGDKKEGYPIMTTGVQNADKDAHLIFSGSYKEVDGRFTNQVTGTDPVRMKYKSTPHAVLALNYANDGAQRCLPILEDWDPVYASDSETWPINPTYDVSPGNKFFWEGKDSAPRVIQEHITYSFSKINGSFGGAGGPEYGWLWLGELYNDNISNRFGGQTEEAFENNLWVPCGDPVSLIGDTGIKPSVTIEWIEGDTYYQRYDHLKTYPFTLEDQNAITDIVSFMCETRVNIDGRYDRNRGQASNFATTPENFNLLNDVYSQQNNFFNYRALNPNKLNLDNFHNSLTWTKTKTAGELVDTWTNITLASTLDLDGDKGSVRAIRRFNNELIAFQDRGISNILFNSRTQLASTEGVPIEIANSGKVDGKRYLSDRIGCTNKWSICESPNGIYFIDDITKGIFLFNGQLNNISDKLGFHSWINAKSNSINIWNPVDFKGFVTYYDKVNGDIFFISKEECLAYSEPLGQFTSFYSYENMPYFINLEDRGIAFNTSKGGTSYKAWLHNEGDYNMFFDSYQPFYTTVIANPDITSDKIFNNLEFRADSWDKNSKLLNTTFDKLYTWNEYQSGESKLNNVLGRPSDLKKKFRVWRANIPRSKSNGRDRMRNPWLYIKLAMEEENTNKTLLHDIVVHYFD